LKYLTMSPHSMSEFYRSFTALKQYNSSNASSICQIFERKIYSKHMFKFRFWVYYTVEKTQKSYSCAINVTNNLCVYLDLFITPIWIRTNLICASDSSSRSLICRNWVRKNSWWNNFRIPITIVIFRAVRYICACTCMLSLSL
jgi:hypothetical protein